MKKRNNPIPKEYQRPRHIGFADDFEAQEKLRMVGVDEWDRNCDGETYENLDLRHLDFSYGSYIGTSFINCDLRGCFFSGANLTSASFKDSNLSDSVFNGGLANLHAVVSNTSFENSDLRNVYLQVRGDLLSCNWNNSNIDGANIRDKNFILYLLNRNPLSDVYIFGHPKFHNAELKDVDLRGVNLQGADLYAALLDRSNLQDANLEDANLGSAYLQGANLQGANLQNADLSHMFGFRVDLQNANLQGALLGGAYLQGANLNGANLQGAKYTSFTKGLTSSQKSVMTKLY